MKREEQKISDTWDLTQIYKDEKLVKEDVKSALNITKQLVDNKEVAFSNKDNTLETIKKLEELDILIEKAYVYAHHKLDQDILNEENQKLAQYVESNYYEIAEKLSFIQPMILNHKDEIISFYNEDEFKAYRKYFDDIFRFSNHTLSEKEEALISMTGEMAATASKAYSSLTDSEFEYKDIIKDGENLKLTSGNYYTFITDSDREVRRQAFFNLYTPYKKHNNTLAILYLGQIKQAIFYTKARGYENDLQKALYGNKIETLVYDNLVNSINDNLSVNHDYVQFRKDVLGVDKLEFYDLYVSLMPEFDKNVSYNKAKETTYNALSVLGDEYKNILEQAFDNRWIDIYENENKRSGAYSGGTYKTPAYILLNYTDKLNDLFTLVHELGHSAHTYLANENNDFFSASYKIFVAEVASTVNELILINYLLQNAENKEEQKYLLNYLLEQFRTTVLRQTMFAEFEKTSHSLVEDKKEVTKETLNDLYFDLNQRYFGPAMHMTEDIKFEWSRIPHFYYNFYVYQYATSFCAAVEISSRIIDEEPGFVDKYLNFLKLGDSVAPIDALKTLDIDLTKSDVIDNAMKQYGNILQKLKGLYK